jgi:hypothetical protein
MTGSSPPRTSVWERSRSTVPGQAFAPGLAFVLAAVAEFRRANAAAERYEQLRRTARACDVPEASPTRRVYVEFYSDR